MEKVFNQITGISPDLFIAVLLAGLFTVEQLFANVAPLAKRVRHLGSGVGLQIGYVALNFGLATLVVRCLDWIAAHEVGLFNVVHLPYYAEVGLGVLGIDFVSYWAHRLNHTWEPFWRLHRVHHSDVLMDSSTTYRFHPFDAVLDNLAAVVAAMLFGLDGATLVLWLLLYVPLLVLHHAHFTMPPWFDRTVGRVLVSPNAHKIHHHQQQQYTDSNYGLLFVFWDKLFRTFTQLPVHEINYGLSEFDTPARQTLWFLLRSPFINVKK